MIILKITELYTLKEWILWYVVYLNKAVIKNKKNKVTLNS